MFNKEDFTHMTPDSLIVYKTGNKFERLNMLYYGYFKKIENWDIYLADRVRSRGPLYKCDIFSVKAVYHKEHSNRELYDTVIEKVKKYNSELNEFLTPIYKHQDKFIDELMEM